MAKKDTTYTVTVAAGQGSPAVKLTLGDPKSARIVVQRYRAEGRDVEVTHAER